MDIEKDISDLRDSLDSIGECLTAFGDETRQYLILEMMKMKRCNGVRAVEIADFVNLSRPAVSHHLQILKRAGIIKSRKEGTEIYYFFDKDAKSIKKMISVMNDVVTLCDKLNDIEKGEQTK